MLAGLPAVPSGYGVPMTLASVVVAIAVTGLGLAISMGRKRPRAALPAGAVVGVGVGSMHFTGVAALRVPIELGLRTMKRRAARDP